MKSINQVTLMGNLTKDPVLRYTPGGTAVASFSLATNRTWTDKNTNTKKDEVQFHNIVVWGKSAEVISQYVYKGHSLIVQGRLQTRVWDDQKSGVKKYITEIIAEDFYLLTQKGGGQVENHVENSEPVEDIVIPDDFGEAPAGEVKNSNGDQMPF
jgi:single-strand DNA-binding protein